MMYSLSIIRDVSSSCYLLLRCYCRAISLLRYCLLSFIRDACAHGDLEIVSKYIRQDPGGLDAYDMYFKKKIREYFVE